MIAKMHDENVFLESKSEAMLARWAAEGEIAEEFAEELQFATRACEMHAESAEVQREEIHDLKVHLSECRGILEQRECEADVLKDMAHVATLKNTSLEAREAHLLSENGAVQCDNARLQ